MPRKKKVEEKKQETPASFVVDSNRQIFTYSENKLLDQITTEVMEAWRKDLGRMRQVYKKVDEIVSKLHENIHAVEELSHKVLEKSEEIDKLLNKIKFKKWWQFWR